MEVPVSKVLKKAKDAAANQIKNKKPTTVPDAAKLAVQAAKVAIKNHKFPRADIESSLSRIIPVPNKIGGALPLIPIFAGLSALGALMGGSASVANAAISASNAKKNFNEAQLIIKLCRPLLWGIIRKQDLVCFWYHIEKDMVYFFHHIQKTYKQAPQ